MSTSKSTTEVVRDLVAASAPGSCLTCGHPEHVHDPSVLGGCMVLGLHGAADCHCMRYQSPDETPQQLADALRSRLAVAHVMLEIVMDEYPEQIVGSAWLEQANELIDRTERVFEAAIS